MELQAEQQTRQQATESIPKVTNVRDAKMVLEKCQQLRKEGVVLSDKLKAVELQCYVLVRGANPGSDGFYQSPEWRTLRYSVLRARGRKCECCGCTPADGRSVHVDHIEPRSKNPARELDPNNLQILCADCNIGKSNTDSIAWGQA